METTTDDLLARRDKLLGPAYRLFCDQPVHLVRGEGVRLYDKAGRKYLKLRPPMVLHRADAEFMLGRLDESLRRSGGRQ